MTANDDFFKGKRPWSVIKDNVLRDYMPAYLAKVGTLGRRILLVDGYAGPGIFEDGTKGSPVIICDSAETRAMGNYEAIFVNKDRGHHEKLSAVLEHGGWSGPARALRGDAREIIGALPRALHDQTVFLYMDPFGPTGCEFSLLEPFLRRDHGNASTEVVLTMSMPAMHRLATRLKLREGQRSDQVLAGHHNTLTRVLGGDYWKEVLWQDGCTAEEREWRLIEAYSARLRQYLPFAKYCPVRETQDSRIKYFIVFASRHADALLLMNDSMAKAYHGHIHRQNYRGSLWERVDWRSMRGPNDFADELDGAIIAAVTQQEGQTRAQLWRNIVDKHFMLYTRAEYNQAVKRLIDSHRVRCPPDPRTRRLNDSCRVFLAVR